MPACRLKAISHKETLRHITSRQTCLTECVKNIWKAIITFDNFSNFDVKYSDKFLNFNEIRSFPKMFLSTLKRCLKLTCFVFEEIFVFLSNVNEKKNC